MMTDFQIVTRRKGKRGFRPQKDLNSSNDTSQHPVDCSSEVDITDLIQKINNASSIVADSEFYRDFKKLLLPERSGSSSSGLTSPVQNDSQLFTEIVCYGLGNFADCIIARYQLGLLLALRNEEQLSGSKVYLFDPKFWRAEKEALEKLGLNLIEKNEEGKRQASTATLFYMPHCGKMLYNNLLWANWSTSLLANITIIGNSFNNICNSSPDRELQKSCPYITKICPFTVEKPLSNNFQYSDIFNDTSIHTFPSVLLASVSKEFWEDCPEPVYDISDIEYIPSLS